MDKVAWDTSICAAVWLSEHSLNCFHCKMQCFGCNQLQCKRLWTPAQWKAEKPNIHGRAYCYQCDPEMYGRSFSEALNTFEVLSMLLRVNYSPACQRHFYLFMMAWKQNVVGTEAFTSLKRIGALPIFFEDVIQGSWIQSAKFSKRIFAEELLEKKMFEANICRETSGNNLRRKYMQRNFWRKNLRRKHLQRIFLRKSRRKFM